MGAARTDAGEQAAPVLDRHGGTGETLRSLYLIPELVDPDAAYPAEATAERGRVMTERFVDAAVRFIERWNEMRPPGT